MLTTKKKKKWNGTTSGSEGFWNPNSLGYITNKNHKYDACKYHLYIQSNGSKRWTLF